MGDATDTLNGRFSVLILLDSALDVLKKVYLPHIKTMRDFLVTNDNKILIASTAITKTEWITELFTKQWGYHFLSLIDTNSSLLWTDTVNSWSDGRQVMSNKVAQLADGNFLHVCEGPSSKWLLFFKVTSTGIKIGEDSLNYNKLKAIGIGNPVSYCIPVSFERTLDNGYYLVWRSPSSPFTYTFQSGCYAMKFDSLGNFWWPWSTGVKNVNTTDCNIYPNPTQTHLTIETVANLQSIKLFDILGQQIPISFTQYSVGYELDLPVLANGVYFLKLQDETGNLSTKKVMIE